jgi:glycosyltransferase involved in cell wall biosynthesis
MTQADWPSVSAVIPTRDRPELLARAVQSVLNQSYPGPLECVIVFDQQSPKMPDVKVPEGRPVRLIQNERTPGLAGARNSGATACTSDLLAWCDDDDEWLPDKLRRQVEAMQQTPGAAVATCGICVCVGNRRHLKSPAAPGVVPRAALLRSRQAWIHSTTLLIQRDRFFGDIGPVDEAVPGSYGEDYEWVLRASNAATIVAVPEALVRVYWQTSYYSDRWDVMISGIQYHLDKHPELTDDTRNAARMYGRLAFAYGASGMSVQARSWARRSIGLNWRQPRGYLAILVAGRLLSPRRVMSVAHAIGKGV